VRITNLSENFIALHAREVHVQKQHIGWNVFDEFHAFQSVASFTHYFKVALTLKECFDATTKEFVVVNE